MQTIDYYIFNFFPSPHFSPPKPICSVLHAACFETGWVKSVVSAILILYFFNTVALISS